MYLCLYSVLRMRSRPELRRAKGEEEGVREGEVWEGLREVRVCVRW